MKLPSGLRSRICWSRNTVGFLCCAAGEGRAGGTSGSAEWRLGQSTGAMRQPGRNPVRPTCCQPARACTLAGRGSGWLAAALAQAKQGREAPPAPPHLQRGNLIHALAIQYPVVGVAAALDGMPQRLHSPGALIVLPPPLVAAMRGTARAQEEFGDCGRNTVIAAPAAHTPEEPAVMRGRCGADAGCAAEPCMHRLGCRPAGAEAAEAGNTAGWPQARLT